MTKPVFTIKHNVVAITLDSDLRASRGDVLIVPIEGDAQPVVMPGTSFKMLSVNGEDTEKVTSVKVRKTRKKKTTKFGISKPLSKGDLSEQEIKYLETISSYAEPMTALELSILLEEDYGVGGNFQSNVLRPLYGAGLLHREKVASDLGKRSMWAYRITSSGKRMVAKGRKM